MSKTLTLARSPGMRVGLVGLVGLGLMGRGIGLSLLRTGHSPGIVAHRRRETAQELSAAGAWEAADSAALAARRTRARAACWSWSAPR